MKIVIHLKYIVRDEMADLAHRRPCECNWTVTKTELTSLHLI
jgi:hypothetical protein